MTVLNNYMSSCLA